ncbi:MAG: hypothetical protein EBV03_05835 [Proteobacteria bacterium]|nr:hypothetical protein [Pseudomonadota bacterium]
MNPEIIGGAAAFLTTVAFVPQLIKVLKHRDTHSISLAMYVVFTTGVALWFCYGLMLASWPMIAANAATFLMAFIILIMKIRLG